VRGDRVLNSLAELIHREGPIPFDRFMEAALYDPERGFFATGQGARRDFVTSPEVGSLFGACVARALDRVWHDLEEADPFLVVEAGAGSGRLAQAVLHAQPECLRALRYVLVERSAHLRAEQRTRLPLDPPDEALGAFVRQGEDAPVPAPRTGPVFAALGELPAVDAPDGVVFANELLDNLPFGIAEFDGSQWFEVRVGVEGDAFVEVPVPLPDPMPPVPAGTRVPIPTGLREWFVQCDRVLRRGQLILVDYMVDEPELRLRTYRGHERGDDPLAEPGAYDITADVVVPQLVAAATGFTVAHRSTQADWLRALGIEELADEGAAIWRSGAARGDLEALKGRSFVHEASVLTDPAGLGSHQVVALGR
jgi:SAM-dependent MidA family methyltransferase